MKKIDLVALIREEINIALSERELTPAELDKREEIVKDLKKKESQFRKDYGDDWESVMYATATKMAKKEEN